MAPLGETVRHKAKTLLALSQAYVRVVGHPVETALALRHPAIREDFPSFRTETGAVLLRGTLGLAGGAVLLRRISPRLLWPLATGVAAALATEQAATSAARARHNNWPPGRRGRSLLAWATPTHYADRARRYGPVFSSNFLAQPQACVMGNARAIEVLRDNAEALGHQSFAYFDRIPGGSFRDKQGLQHRQDRAVIASGLTPRLLDSLAPRFRAEFDAMFAAMATASAAGGSASPREYVEATVFRLWQDVFFGIRLHPDEADEFQRLYRSARSTRDSGDRGEKALQAIEARIRAAVEPGLADGTAPTCVLTQALARHPEALDDPHLRRVLIFLSNTSTRDMTGLLTWLSKHLADNPAWLEALADEAAAGSDPGPGSLADHVASETLRMEQSEYLHLVVKDDVEVEGYTVPKGWRLRVCVHENHRDPATFEDPDTYRPDRFANRTYARHEYGPFGLDDHSCLGEALGRTAARAFVLALAGYRLRVVQDGERLFRSSYHFAPSSRLRVALTPRA